VSDILSELYELVRDREANPKEGSYVNKLLTGGEDKILKKVAEEAGEVLLAAKNDSREEIVWEVADLWFHTVVLLGQKGIPPSEIYAHLESRKR
jgi:phosphoribosyl-ATP pyrophosphohydrolase/phosphoribosyl-AMP cyclohydrolase